MFWVTTTQIMTKHTATSETFHDSLEIVAPSNSTHFSPDGIEQKCRQTKIAFTGCSLIFVLF